MDLNLFDSRDIVCWPHSDKLNKINGYTVFGMIFLPSTFIGSGIFSNLIFIFAQENEVWIKTESGQEKNVQRIVNAKVKMSAITNSQCLNPRVRTGNVWRVLYSHPGRRSSNKFVWSNISRRRSSYIVRTFWLYQWKRSCWRTRFWCVY